MAYTRDEPHRKQKNHGRVDLVEPDHDQ